MNPVDPNDPNLILSPLADPVVSAIFTNAEVAGLASESISSCSKFQRKRQINQRLYRRWFI